MLGLIFDDSRRLKSSERLDGTAKLFDRTPDRSATFTTYHATFDGLDRRQSLLDQPLASVPKYFAHDKTSNRVGRILQRRAASRFIQIAKIIAIIAHTVPMSRESV